MAKNGVAPKAKKTGAASAAKAQLQAAVKDLRRTNEALQAVNEELRTANGDLTHRVAELAGANADLKTLLQGTRIAETRQALLLEELQHRVRNILAVVRSIVSRTVRNSTDVEEMAAHLDGRLETLARTQGVFTRTGLALVGLEELIRDELASVAAREEQLTVKGPALSLRREAAETMALALHELTTNAVKYGALSEPDGKVSVTWRLMSTSQGKRLSLQWKEKGVRALPTEPSRYGFGRELIERGLPYELGATTELEFERGGVRALIELPLTERVAELDDARETLQP